MSIFSSAEVIQSRNNRTIAEIAGLGADKKFRERDGLFLIEGTKLFAEAIKFHVSVKKVLICEAFADKINTDSVFRPLVTDMETAQNRGAEIIIARQEAFEKASTERAPQGIIAVAERDALRHRRINCVGDDHISPYDATDGRLAMLESVRDPANLGAILRCASAFGFHRLLLTGDCAELYNPKTLRASMGALFRVRTDTFVSAPDAVEQLRRSGRRVLAARLDETSVIADRTVLRQTDCIVIGNEGHGISVALNALCDGGVYIPMDSGTESLNAAAAAAVLLWEQLHAEKAME